MYLIIFSLPGISKNFNAAVAASCLANFSNLPLPLNFILFLEGSVRLTLNSLPEVLSLGLLTDSSLNLWRGKKSDKHLTGNLPAAVLRGPLPDFVGLPPGCFNILEI